MAKLKCSLHEIKAEKKCLLLEIKAGKKGDNKMRKQIQFIAFILLSFTTLYSQKNSAEFSDKLKIGSEIILNARKAIGLGEIKIDSFSYKTKQVFFNSSESDKKAREKTEEIKVVLPDKIHTVLVLAQGSESTSIWNQSKYKSFIVLEMLGERYFKDTTNSEERSLSDDSMKVLEGRIDKEKLENLKKASSIKRPDPKQSFYEKLWTDFFPMTFSHPFEKDLNFVFIGKAQTVDKTANIVDLNPTNGKKYRLLFDAETNDLLMMIVRYKREDLYFIGDVETKYYFSNRKKMGGIVVPLTIKAETKLTPLGNKETKLLFQLKDIEEFKINPELKESLFEIK